MQNKYRHIMQYEKEIFELREKGYTNKEVGEKLGFTREQIRGLIKRHNKKQRQIEAGIIPKKKGRVAKEYIVTGDSKISELKYIIARKDVKIRRLEMENELMRDFLSHTERK